MDKCPEVVVEINQLRHDQVFHYLLPDGMPDLELGRRVLVPFGNKTVQGWVVGHSAPPPGVTLRPIQSVAGEEPDFNPELLRLARWMADYYLHPLPEVLKLMAAPEKPVRSGKQSPAEGMTLPDGAVSGHSSGGWAGHSAGRLMLNAEQGAALREIEAALLAGRGTGGRAPVGGVGNSAGGRGTATAVTAPNLVRGGRKPQLAA